MTKSQLTITALAASIVIAVTLSATVAGQERGAAVFKAPDGWLPADKSELGPSMFLNPKKPAVIFVTYPKPDETTTEQQRQRLRTVAVGMFLGIVGEINWQVKSIPSHPGDGDGKAEIATVKHGDKEVQIVTYERTTGPRPFIYGYMAMRHEGKKSNSAPFLDENGKGVKEFEKLWKSFSDNNRAGLDKERNSRL
jgi:hypothetical protein